MGCDSHPHIEVKRRNGRWGLVDNKRRRYDQLEKEGKGYEDLDKIRPSYLSALGNRNYTLFAVLADVRNYNGAIIPLFAERGVPEDVSKATMNGIPFDSDYHSHTYFTLRELLDTDWDSVGCKGAEIILYADDYTTWKETGKLPEDPDEYPENASDDDTREVTDAEMVMLLMSNKPEELVKKVPSQWDKRRKVKSGPYVKAMVPLTYRQLIPNFIKTIPDMKELGDPDKVRVVIAFDN